MAKVTIEYFGVEGTGRNLTEAKRDAGRKIEAALSGRWEPLAVAWRGNAVLVYRDPLGWRSCHVADADTGVRGSGGGTQFWGSTEISREEAVANAQLHVAQQGWLPEDGDTPPDFLTDRRASQFRSWVKFQLRYARARAAGCDDREAHDYGCGCLSGGKALAERVEGKKVTAGQRVLGDIRTLASGTLATQTGVADCATLDAVQAEFLDWATKRLELSEGFGEASPWGTWQDAWQGFVVACPQYAKPDADRSNVLAARPVAPAELVERGEEVAPVSGARCRLCGRRPRVDTPERAAEVWRLLYGNTAYCPECAAEATEPQTAA